MKHSNAISLFLAFVGVASANNECSLTCNGHGTCKLPDVAGGERYCECDDGYTGRMCGKEVHSCADGKHRCFHGGKCLSQTVAPGLPAFVDVGSVVHYCDCSNAQKDGTTFVGKYCEHPVAVECDDSGKWFCANGGTCKSDYKDHPVYPCKCPDDYEGTHCEFDKGQMPQCALKCQNEGKCKLGFKTYSEASTYLGSFWSPDWGKDWKRHEAFMHCVCPEGYGGVLCDVKLTQCGNSQCFYNAPCTTNGEQCDCAAIEKPLKSYAGLKCQYMVYKFCSEKGDHNGRMFCVNDGICPDASHEDCTCTGDYSGPHCEYSNKEVAAGLVPECDLQCLNKGKCRLGKKDVSESKYSEVPGLKETHDGNFKHCVCPAGFAGVKCEIPIEYCGDGICLHGSKCVENKDSNGKVTMGCDCTHAAVGLTKYTGQYCEYESTSLCVKNPEENGVGTESFCANQGTCKVIQETVNKRHGGCDCPPGFYGNHCGRVQTLDMFIPPNESSDGNEPVAKGGKVGISFLTIGAVVVLAFVAYKMKERQRTGKEKTASSSETIGNVGYTDYPEPPPGDSFDSGTDSSVELNDVELT